MVKIFDTFFKKRKRYFSKKDKVQETISELKNELDCHLDAINENTNEIQMSYECMNEINEKTEKLAQRMERIELFLQMHSNFSAEEQTFSVKPLTKTEQHVFLVIYALENEQGMVSCNDIARKTGLPNYMVHEYAARLIEKGVPLIKKYVNDHPFIKLNPEFKRLQAKENLIEIDTAQKELVTFN